MRADGTDVTVVLRGLRNRSAWLDCGTRVLFQSYELTLGGVGRWGDDAVGPELVLDGQPVQALV